MRKIAVWAVSACLLLLVGCAHRHGPGHGHGSGPLAQGSAGVHLVEIGGSVLPIVTQEPLVIPLARFKENELPRGEWMVSPGTAKAGRGIVIRITGYRPLPEARSIDDLIARSGDRLPAACPLVGKKPDTPSKECACPVKDGVAICEFSSRQRALFSYDICVSEGNVLKGCKDPTGMIF